MKKALSMGMAAVMSMTACGPAPKDDSENTTTKVAGQRDANIVITRYTGQQLFAGLFFGKGTVAQKLPQLWAPGMPGAPRPAAGGSSVDLAKQLELETAGLQKAGLSAQSARLMKSATSALARDPLSADQLSKGAALDQAATSKTMVSDTAVANILAVIAKNDPTFFARFAKDIQSGDPLAVSAAVAESGVQLANSAPEAAERTKATLAQGGLASSLISHGLGESTDIDVDAEANIDIDLEIEVDIAAVAFIAVAAFLVIAAFFVQGPRDIGNTSDALRHETWMKIIAADLAV